MNRRQFLKNFGLGVSVAAIPTTILSLSEKRAQFVKDNELSFNLIKEDEVFHPILKEYKVNKMGEISYINYRGKVRIATVGKRKDTGQVNVRLKDRVIAPHRFIFEAFSQVSLNQSYVVVPRDGNDMNLCIENLACIRKKDYKGYKELGKTAIRDSSGRILKWV
jgi:hypothetical protein